MARRSRGLGYISVTADVEVDLDEVLREIETEELASALSERGVRVNPDKFCPSDLDLVNEAISELERGFIADALHVLRRLVEPKWPTHEACMVAFAKQRSPQ